MTNTQADRVKEVARLAGRPSRLRRREFLAEGPQAVREALLLDRQRHDDGAAGVVVDVYATIDALDRHLDIAGLLSSTGAPSVRLVTADVLAAMSATVTPQGFVAVCRFIDSSLDDVLAAGPRLVAVLVEVRDPGNAGTIIRAADSAGADAVILTGASVDPYNPKTVRSTAGSLFHLPLVIGADLDGLPGRLRSAGLTVLAADGYGATNLDDLQDASASRRVTPEEPGGPSPTGGPRTVPTGESATGGPRTVPTDGPPTGGPPTGRARTVPTGEPPIGRPRTPPDDPADAGRAVRLEDPTAWLFGNEAQGLAGDVSAASDGCVAVPLYGRAESLNVGTAATVCLYASARAQRRG